MVCSATVGDDFGNVTGFSLVGWELATGRVKGGQEIYSLYRKPFDRDFSRDYTEGRLTLGNSMPEGLVYFPEVLAYYLQHRPASRLWADPEANEPIGHLLRRLNTNSTSRCSRTRLNGWIDISRNNDAAILESSEDRCSCLLRDKLLAMAKEPQPSPRGPSLWPGLTR